MLSIDWGQALASRVTIGVLTGLVIGKFVGVTGFCWIAVQLGFARLPQGVTWKHLAGAGWLAGIGFTMSLFITQLAFREPHLVAEAKLGILVASALSATLGLAWLFWAGSDNARLPLRKPR